MTNKSRQESFNKIIHYKQDVGSNKQKKNDENL